MTTDQRAQAGEVVQRVLDAIRANITIKLPPFDPQRSRAGETALQHISAEANDFGGQLGEFRYQFEGEDDLLHLFITRASGDPLTVEEGQTILAALIPQVPPGLVWVKPGNLSQHFYMGHEVLLSP